MAFVRMIGIRACATLRHGNHAYSRIVAARAHIPARSKLVSGAMATIALPPTRLLSQVVKPQSVPLLTRFRGLVAISGVSAAVGGFAYTAYKVSMYVSGLNIQHGMAAGLYAGGAVSALVGVGGFLFLRRFLSIHPETLFREVNRRVNADPSITTLLGSRTKPGKFRAYAYTGGLIFKDRSIRKSLLDAVTFKRYGCQFMYQVNSDDTMAMVSAEAVQTIVGGYQITNLAVDFQNGDRIVLEGDPNEVVFQGVVKLR